MHWINFGVENHFVSESGEILARVTKNGCCWYATIGQQPMSSGRFSRLEDAKFIVEKLLEVPVGN